MTTIINTPPSGNNSDSGLGLIAGVIIAIVLIVLFFIYGLPALRRNQAPNNNDSGSTNINVSLPGSTTSPAGGTSSGSAY